MDELEIYRTIVELAREGRHFAVATVLQAAGPTPSRAGAQAVIHADASILGTVGGGIVEASTIQRAIQAMESQDADVVEFDLKGQAASDTAPVCGGSVTILIDPLAVPEVYGQAADTLQRRERGAITMEIQESGGRTVVWAAYLSTEDASSTGDDSLAAQWRAAQRQGQAVFDRTSSHPRKISGWYVQPVMPPPRLLVFGAGHVGTAVAALAIDAGFEVVIIDDREDFAVSSRFSPQVTVRCGAIEDQICHDLFDTDTYVVIVTRSHQLDAQVLEACLKQRSAYIGMIGSRRKVEVLKLALVESGKATAQELAGVYAPIGLDIGAQTVREIAVSIVAQLISVRRTGNSSRIGAERE